MEGTNDAASTPENTESEQSAEASGEAEADDPEPVPASSEGPAQNWPVPEPPDEIYEPTEEGAEAALHYWYEARHYARVTGDFVPLEYASAQDCAICDHEREVFQEVFSNDGWYVSAPDEIGDLYIRLDSEVLATGILALHESDFETYWHGELYSETVADSVEAFGFALVYEEGRWLLIETNYLGEYDPEHSEQQDPESTDSGESP
ncbi:hypothetical protein GCM10011359_14960 [Nesterenkonia alkaliphila]|nr:hypothetical protein GCM10011359_14960 [Nesterenkonia alkaliphila]